MSSITDIDASIVAIFEKRLECFDKFATYREIKSIQNPNKWISNEIRKTIIKRVGLYRKQISNSSAMKEEDYQKQRSNVTYKNRDDRKGNKLQELGSEPTPKMVC